MLVDSPETVLPICGTICLDGTSDESQISSQLSDAAADFAAAQAMWGATDPPSADGTPEGCLCIQDSPCLTVSSAEASPQKSDKVEVLVRIHI